MKKIFKISIIWFALVSCEESSVKNAPVPVDYLEYRDSGYEPTDQEIQSEIEQGLRNPDGTQINTEFSFSNVQLNRFGMFMDAICEVESNGDCSKIGKVGEIGCYQIRECFWIDALEQDPSIGGVYEDCINKEYAEKVMLAYWERYATEKILGREPTFEDLARIHNGGPNGCKKKATVVYWLKVKQCL